MNEKKIMLSDILEKAKENTEFTVTDKDYFMETYFYPCSESADKWDKAMMRIASVLEVTCFAGYFIEVNFSDVIEKNLEALKKADLFKICETDAIMDDIENVLAGYVSEDWLTEFANVLVEGQKNGK